MAYRKLGRNIGQRRAMLRNITTSLLKNGRIETTETKAKELASVVEKMITLAKKGDLSSRRIAAAYLMEENVVKDLFDVIAKKYAERQGGYTRITKVRNRRGDAALVVIIELV